MPCSETFVTRYDLGVGSVPPISGNERDGGASSSDDELEYRRFLAEALLDGDDDNDAHFFGYLKPKPRRADTQAGGASVPGCSPDSEDDDEDYEPDPSEEQGTTESTKRVRVSKKELQVRRHAMQLGNHCCTLILSQFIGLAPRCFTLSIRALQFAGQAHKISAECCKDNAQAHLASASGVSHAEESACTVEPKRGCIPDRRIACFHIFPSAIASRTRG